MRRLLIAVAIAAPALFLIGWLVASQLPRWTAPQANWFASDTPGVCAAVGSLALYRAYPANVGGIGGDTAILNTAQAVAAHYDFGTAPLPSRRSEPLGVQATLPGDQQHGYYVITMALSGDALPKIAIVYVDAQTGDIKALITAIADPAATCDFDVKAALLAAVKAPPTLLLAGYAALVIVGLIAGWMFRRRGTHR